MRSTIALAAALAMPMMGSAVELSDDMLNKVYDLMGSMTKHTYVSSVNEALGASGADPLSSTTSQSELASKTMRASLGSDVDSVGLRS